MHLMKALASLHPPGCAALPPILRGVAIMEFALSMPLVLMFGCYGIELSNLARANLQVSQIALNLADNASRVGNSDGLAAQQLREVDINDVLQGARFQGNALQLTHHGRITVSSLENVQQTYDSDAGAAHPLAALHRAEERHRLQFELRHDHHRPPAPTDTIGNAGTTSAPGWATRLAW